MDSANRSSGSICDRLKQRYGTYQRDWPLFFQGKNTQDFEYIQYIVNFIIEQAKHNIVISELPEVIQTLHTEAEGILRKNRMITLQEVIAQVQRIGALKYPYLQKVKPTCTEDFIKEVMREVFDRLGTIITLDMIENICQFTTCSAKQLLQTMPAIDVDEAATLIAEDISRNQRENQNVLKKTISFAGSSSKAGNRQVERNLENVPALNKKGWISRSIQNLKQSLSKTKLSEHKDAQERRKKSQSPQISSASRQSSKNINKNQQSPSADHINPISHFTQTIFVPIDTGATKECSPNESDNKMLNTKPDRSTSKSIIKEKPKNRKAEIVNPSISNMGHTESNIYLVPISNNQTIKLSPSQSNTQTYSIHSEEGLAAHQHIAPMPSPTTLSRKTALISREIFESKDRPLILEAMYGIDKKANMSSSKTLQSIRHYSKCSYQHSDINDNEEQITEIDTESCPLEDILNYRLIPQI